MKTYKNTLFLASAICIATSSVGHTGTLTIVNKIPDQRIQLFIRGEGTDTHHIKVVEAGEKKDFIVSEENVHGKPTFEVTASTGNGGNPDWKLLGGTCATLVTDSDHILVIDSTLGKLSCTNVTADNPPARKR